VGRGFVKGSEKRSAADNGNRHDGSVGSTTGLGVHAKNGGKNRGGRVRPPEDSPEDSSGGISSIRDTAGSQKLEDAGGGPETLVAKKQRGIGTRSWRGARHALDGEDQRRGRR